MKKLTLILIVIATLSLAACKKQAGKGGSASIKGIVTYTNKAGDKSPASGATVHLVFNETYDTKTYDVTVTAGANGQYEITDLKKGQYFIFAEYFDATDSITAEEGFPVNIEKRKESLEKDIDLEF